MSHWYEDHPGMTPADWGRINYEAYLAARKPCDHSPEWKHLPENVREAWAVAAQAVRQCSHGYAHIRVSVLDSAGKEVPGPADSVEAAGNDGFDSGTMFIMAEADGKPIPDGCRYEENPYSEGSPEHKAWADEWIEASGK